MSIALVTGSSYVGLPRREADVFRQTTATANSNQTIWTPATGKRFRLLGYAIDVTGDANVASATHVTISLTDSGTLFGLSHSVYIPASGTVNGNLAQWAWDLGGIGYLSSTVGNSLQLLPATALTAGLIRVRVQGVEE